MWVRHKTSPSALKASTAFMESAKPFSCALAAAPWSSSGGWGLFWVLMLI